ncbi:hypothetical protein [Polycladomyces subterraneus]|uniref:Uncharacterized protein n=1 Tax=Polycladomyces subterraneus TaxID=1016997 RepID=A0ABT8IPU3_9BACL|nr:hypothetical protein [Polycladomyces subterraneus]MDN4594798.1 hypothetical protein [Polycladomyces subterraneus]
MGWTLLVVGLFLLIRLVRRLSRGDQRRPLSRQRMAETDRARHSYQLNEVSRTDFTPENQKKGTSQDRVVLTPQAVSPRMRLKQTKKRSPIQWAREDWSRAIVMQEILGPPRALRPFRSKFPRGR